MPSDLITQVPHEVLFGNPAFLKPEVSPDGSTFYYLAPDDGVLNIFAAPVASPLDAAPVTQDRGRGIRSFGCCPDDRTLYYLRDADGDENWRLYLLDLTTGAESCVTPFDGVQARVLAHYPWHPDVMLIGLNRDRRHLHDVYRLSLRTHELAKVAVNPGFLSWLIDADLAVRGGTAPRPDGGMAIYLDPPASLLDPAGVDPAGIALPAPLLEASFEDAMGTRVVAFARDGKTLYLLSSIGADTTRLLAVDVATREQRLLAEHPVHDVRQVLLHPETGSPQAVIFAADRDEWLFLDDDLSSHVGHVRAELAGQGIEAELYIDRCDQAGACWTVTAVASDYPVRYYLYNPSDRSLRFAFTHQPDLERYQLAKMEPFRFRARDGVEVHGYLTRPPGTEGTAVPAVLNVHGGPWARNTYSFNEEAQLLANRGYACVEVNFRGSTGFGKRFRALGTRQWGAAMHNDLLDAVTHLAAKGAIDPARVAIMGCSYGGYAALTGAAVSPGTFRCAIDLCGPANLLTLLANGAPYRSPLLAFMKANIGDPETERDLLWERSPLSRAAGIRVPVLVAQGANDVRVTRDEAEQIVSALAAHGVPHEYLLFEDEGHGLTRSANKMTYYSAVERFLARHLA